MVPRRPAALALREVAQHEIEIILARQLASYLSTPVFLVDREGTLLFYNEAAEGILGRRFSETGALGLDEWSRTWRASDTGGAPLGSEHLPLVIAVREKRPSNAAFWIAAQDGVRRHIEVHAFPLMGIAGTFVGAIALFWEMPA